MGSSIFRRWIFSSAHQVLPISVDHSLNFGKEIIFQKKFQIFKGKYCCQTNKLGKFLLEKLLFWEFQELEQKRLEIPMKKLITNTHCWWATTILLKVYESLYMHCDSALALKSPLKSGRSMSKKVGQMTMLQYFRHSCAALNQIYLNVSSFHATLTEYIERKFSPFPNGWGKLIKERQIALDIQVTTYAESRTNFNTIFANHISFQSCLKHW